MPLKNSQILFLVIMSFLISCKSDNDSSVENSSDMENELGELVNYVDRDLDDSLFEDWGEIETFYGTIEPFEGMLGMYQLDRSKENLHTYDFFQFEFTRDSNQLIFLFDSCSEYGYSESWTKGQTFGIIDEVIDSTEGIFIGRINEHRGPDQFELTEHKIQFNQDEIVIFTGDKYKDHYTWVKKGTQHIK
ncbi:MAG: hypothetical protein ABJG68_16820 [Crocinitomicaceae bacterium]